MAFARAGKATFLVAECDQQQRGPKLRKQFIGDAQEVRVFQGAPGAGSRP
jgi:hypothetical protein